MLLLGIVFTICFLPFFYLTIILFKMLFNPTSGNRSDFNELYENLNEKIAELIVENYIPSITVVLHGLSSSNFSLANLVKQVIIAAMSQFGQMMFCLLQDVCSKVLEADRKKTENFRRV